MNAAPLIRPSACPGLYRLAPARDGGICRVKLALGTLDAAQARAVAGAARDFGNGIIEITSRSNLQLRGIAETDADALADRIYAAGLGAATAAADDVRNLMVSPTSGIDPQAVLDTTPLAQAILALLDARADFHALSPKFSILLDGGESTAPLHHPNDIWLSAVDADRFALGLAGTLGQKPLGWVRAEMAVFTIATIIERFLDQPNPAVTRIRHLGAGAAVLADDLVEPLAGWARSEPATHLGAHRQADASAVWLGARPPLGRLDPGTLEALASLAQEHGNGTIRLTPFQSLLLPAVARPEPALQRLGELGLVTAPDHPLANLLACSGSSGCQSALADTQHDALTLAAQGIGAGLHVSGCEKSCASAQAAPHTLVAVASGRYDLYRRAEGAASRFGEKLASGLTVAAAARKLAQA